MAFAILSLVIVAAHQGYSATLSRFQKTHIQIKTSHSIDTSLAKIAKDFRCAFLSQNAEETFFVSYKDPFSNEQIVEFTCMKPSEQDGEKIEKISYSSTDQYDFEFYDGNSWSSQWGWDDERQAPTRGIRGLPLAVSVKMKQDDSRRIFPIMTSLINKRVY